MAISVDHDQQWLLNCLAATLDHNHDVRSFAEASLQQASLQPGFGMALAKVSVNTEVPFGLRQLAAVLLKQFVKQHWKEVEEAFVHPVVSPAEKTSVRQLLMSSLDDPHGKIRTAIGMAIAFIANYDWPEEWPELLPFLLKLVSNQTNTNGVRGALRCLSLISNDLDDTLVPSLVPVLFPNLHAIVSSPNLYEKSLRAKAISIVHSCTSVLGSISGIYKVQTNALMRPLLSSWMEQLVLILNTPVQAEDPEDWDIRMEVLKCLMQFIQYFPTLAEIEFVVAIDPLLQMFVSCSSIYELSLVNGDQDPYLERCDSDGVEKTLQTFVIQMFELLLTIMGNSKLAGVIGDKIEDLLYYTVIFLQMTEDQVNVWSSDANQYVADEDDATYSCRVSGSCLLEEVVNVYGRDGINSLINVVRKHYNKYSKDRLRGVTNSWKVYEACLFALSSVTESLIEAQSSGLTTINVVDFLHQMLIEFKDVGLHVYPFIHARAFSTVAKFSTLISRNLREHFLYAASQAISSDVPPPVKVGACRALSHLLLESNSAFLQSQIMSLFSSLCDLLNKASEETLHLVLETLQVAVKAGGELSITLEPILSPVVLNMWVQYVADPFISMDALEVLEELLSSSRGFALPRMHQMVHIYFRNVHLKQQSSRTFKAIKNAPGCMHLLTSRILPSISSMLGMPQHQPTGLVAGLFDLLTMILKNAPIDIVKAVYDTCFNSASWIILHTDDHSEMQNGTECLAAIVAGGKQDLISWSPDPYLTIRSLLDVASRLLDPNVESSGSLFVGTYIVQLILHFPSEIALHMRYIIAALVGRMQSSEIAMLKSSLIVILARLIHLSMPDVEQFINMMLSIPANGHDSSFTYMMSEWTKQQGEIQGSYQIKVTITALAMLLSSRHAALETINVQGQLINLGAGITTRSRAKLAPDQWTVVSLPRKIFGLLSDMLIEIQEQVLSDIDEFYMQDNDWEVVQENDNSIQQDIVFSASLSSNSELSVENLDTMAKAFDESDDENDIKVDLLKLDPLNEINLAYYLAGFFTKFANTEKLLFDRLFQSLTHAQRNAIKTILEKKKLSYAV